MEFLKETGRLYLNDEKGNLIAEIVYPEIREGVVEITRTWVDRSLRGQGVAGKLMEAAIAEITAEGKKMVPTCSYAASYMEKHEELASLKTEK